MAWTFHSRNQCVVCHNSWSEYALAFSSRQLNRAPSMIPAMAPLSWQHPDEEVRLGRASEWSEDPYGELVPYGLKSLLVDDAEFPVVEIRELEIYSA